ncbi:uncharacterized protein LOC144070704 [Stigmatopora argus]
MYIACLNLKRVAVLSLLFDSLPPALWTAFRLTANPGRKPLIKSASLSQLLFTVRGLMCLNPQQMFPTPSSAFCLLLDQKKLRSNEGQAGNCGTSKAPRNNSRCSTFPSSYAENTEETKGTDERQNYTLFIL